MELPLLTPCPWRSSWERHAGAYVHDTCASHDLVPCLDFPTPFCFPFPPTVRLLATIPLSWLSWASRTVEVVCQHDSRLIFPCAPCRSVVGVTTKPSLSWSTLLRPPRCMIACVLCFLYPLGCSRACPFNDLVHRSIETPERHSETPLLPPSPWLVPFQPVQFGLVPVSSPGELGDASLHFTFADWC